MNESGMSSPEEENPEAIKQKIKETIVLIVKGYNNLPKMIDIGQTLSVAIGNQEKRQLDLSDDIVWARDEAGISENDIQRFRDIIGWPGCSPEIPQYTDDDLDWLLGYLKKIEIVYKLLLNLGYKRGEIRGSG
ncbi:MAG: hypothetical protein NTW79_00360 [Candidatus Berkelbacteria bacterium]|nr:hypothetical protein [Candidatus Berkelbacteria bacterium]